MGYLAQESSVFRKLSVQNNLLGVMEMLGMDRRTRNRRCEELLEQFGITKLRKREGAVALRRRAAAAGDRPLPSCPIRKSSCSTSHSRASTP